MTLNNKLDTLSAFWIKVFFSYGFGSPKHENEFKKIYNGTDFEKKFFEIVFGNFGGSFDFSGITLVLVVRF